MSSPSRGPHFPRRRRREGMALIVALLMLVLITATVLAFFSQSMMNRTISFSSAGQARANQVALSGLDYIKGDLLEEIQSGSTLKVDSTSGIVIYQPLTSTNMVPYRMTTNVAYNAVMPPNLVKWSSATYPQWPSTGYNQAGPTRSPSSNSTTNAATSGRYISTARWTKPQFIASSTFPTTTVPDWVLMTRQGPLTNVASASSMLTNLADSTPGNGNYVIGRYAYTVYDVGGLLDVTAGGYSPTTFPANDASGIAPTFVGRKGSQGYADLTQLGLTSAQADQLVNWRNATTGATTNTYIAYLSTNAPATGFLQVASGDRTFLGRQDFMQYWNNEVGGSTNIPPYFTTFSREKNAPSWGPTHNASYWSGTNSAPDPSTGATISYAYSDDRDTAGAYTRFFPNVRVQTTFTRLDGTTAVVGEPLVKTRFDLSKLSWVTYNNVPPTGVSSTDIYNYFGLTRNSDGSWTYNHTSNTMPSGTAAQTGSIMTLDQVAAAGREPDFFELLQAAILRGSMGLCSGDYTQQTNDTSNGSGGEFYRLAMGASASFPYEAPLLRSDTDNHVVYAMEKYQVIQIGANIIDQSDSDNFPTEIVLNGEHFYGIENLPYINAIGDTALRSAPGAVKSPKDTTFNDSAQQYVHRWMTASLWNPHQNAAHPPSVGPIHLRIAMTGGEVYPIIHNLSGFPTAGYYMGRKFEPAGTSITTNAGINIDGPAWVAFKLSDYASGFAEPTMIDYSTAYTSDSNNPVSGNMNDGYGLIATQLGWQRAGIYLGWSKSPDSPYKVPLCASVYPQYLTKASPGILYDAAGYTYSSPLKVELQYEDTTAPGTWHTYEVLRGFIHTRGSPIGDPYMEPNDPAWATWYTTVPTSIYGFGGNTVYAGKPNLTGPLTMNQESAVLNFNDPRTVRYNIQTIHNSDGSNLLTANFSTGTSPTISPGADAGPHFPRSSGGKNAGDTPINWVNNQSTTVSYYTDRDNVRRLGDSGGWSGATPLPSGSLSQRPIHLDRPFQSVAELGYVFRDDVWRTLNLFSDRSPDNGLLDVFCIGYGSTNSINQPPPNYVAGKMNINSAIQDTLAARGTSSLPLQAIISQALRTYSSANPSIIDSSSTASISSTDAQTLATSIISYGKTNGPFMNVADLTAVFPQDTSTTSANPGLKWPREAMVRALADSSNTRTWNLMIDIIAQSGKYSRLSGDLNAFVVEGEKHYWLHLAIDRFTGEVVDQQLEPVWD